MFDMKWSWSESPDGCWRDAFDTKQEAIDEAESSGMVEPGGSYMVAQTRTKLFAEFFDLGGFVDYVAECDEVPCDFEFRDKRDLASDQRLKQALQEWADYNGFGACGIQVFNLEERIYEEHQ